MVSQFHCFKLFRFNKIAATNSSQIVASIHINRLFSRPISSNNESLAFSKQKLEESSKPDKNKNKNSNEASFSSSYTVSFLINSCGLSPESAKSASKNVNFKTPEKPDLVIELLKNHGFNKMQISNVVRRCPRLLLSDPNRTLLPKLDFFNSIGFPEDQLAKVLTSNPNLLLRGLENCIRPFHKLLKYVLGDDKLVLAAMKRPVWNVCPNNISANVLLLREMKVPQPKIVFALTHFPDVTMQKHELFRKSVTKVTEMGFDPMKSTFVLAVRAFCGTSYTMIWNRSFKVYKRWGWSEDDILSAFKKHPDCMLVSEEKIERTMDFFVNKMGFKSNVIAERPTVLLYSLEKRIIPRCSVFRVLSLKGIIKKMSLRSILLPSDKEFLERFVTKNMDQLPQLMSLYEGKMGISAL